MNFNNNKEALYYLKRLKEVGDGSQGICYLDQTTKKVLKIYHDYNEEDYISPKEEKEIYQFSNIKNDTFIWPEEIIKVNDIIIGYIAPYIKAKNMYHLNPLLIDLDILINEIKKVYKDIKIISNNGVLTYDVAYNILYNNKFNIIDQDEYTIRDEDPTKLEKQNKRNFNYAIYYFLIDNFFDNVVNDNKELNEMYKTKEEDVLIFIKLLRQRLSELANKEIKYLKDAKKYVKHIPYKDEVKFMRY